MSAAEDFQPLRLPMQSQCITIQMVIRGDEIYIFVPKQEINHERKLNGQINVVILRKIHHIGVPLLQKNF